MARSATLLLLHAFLVLAMGCCFAPVSLAAQGHPIGSTFRDCPGCPEMVVVAGGEFLMGSLPPEPWRSANETPQHRVRFARPFAIGVYNVTRSQYAVFAREIGTKPGKGCNVVDPQARWVTDPGADWRNPAFRQTGNDPVVCVSWHDAQAYVGWLNTKVPESERLTLQSPTAPYRLPSEAEWEYIARAGTTTAYYWGDAANHDYANYGLEECYPCGAAKQGNDRWYYTSPAGAFAPNAFGVYDALGNVWQWTQDCMHDSYVGAPDDGAAWTTGVCYSRILRGGSWLDPGKYLRVAVRNPWSPDNRNYANGFRVARSVD